MDIRRALGAMVLVTCACSSSSPSGDKAPDNGSSSEINATSPEQGAGGGGDNGGGSLGSSGGGNATSDAGASSDAGSTGGDSSVAPGTCMNGSPEVEPNDTTAAAQQLAPGAVIVCGTLGAGDVDYYAFTVTDPKVHVTIDYTATDGSSVVLQADNGSIRYETGVPDLPPGSQGGGGGSIDFYGYTGGFTVKVSSPSGRTPSYALSIAK